MRSRCGEMPTTPTIPETPPPSAEKSAEQDRVERAEKHQEDRCVQPEPEEDHRQLRGDGNEAGQVDGGIQQLPQEPDASDQEAQRNPTKRKRAARSPKEAMRVLAEVYDYYRLDRSSGRDRSQDGYWAEKALYLAARDGLLRAPPRKRGAPSKWSGKLGLELVQAVEATQVEMSLERPRLKPRAKRPTDIKVTGVDKAIERLRSRFSEKWGRYDPDVLKRRFHEAQKHWTYARRLFDRLGAKINSDFPH
jgi:hypothetical protein